MGRKAWEVLVQDLRDVLLASELPAELPAHLAAPLASGVGAPVGSLVGATPLGGPLAPDATIAELSLCDFVSAVIALGFFIANGRGILSPRGRALGADGEANLRAMPDCLAPLLERSLPRVLLRRSYHWVHAERAERRKGRADDAGPGRTREFVWSNDGGAGAG